MRESPILQRERKRESYLLNIVEKYFLSTFDNSYLALKQDMNE